MSPVSVWDGVVGQPEAVKVLAAAVADPVHAYLFVGPPGCTKEPAARAFAALLVDPTADPGSRGVRLALSGDHPDVVEVRREGPAISMAMAEQIVRRAALAPVEGSRKVMILHEFHLIAPPAAAALLKTIEEPPASTVFVILADQSPPELTTIASRCVRVGFRSLTAAEIDARLQHEGFEPERAGQAAAASGGDLDRARLLATDDDLVHRRRVFAEVPHRLDGTGAVVATTVDELLGLIDTAAAPLTRRHEQELAELEERVAATGERGSGRRELVERHKRELRRHRTDELRAGLGAIAGTYRDLLIDHQDTRRPDAFIAAVARIHGALEALDRNPNETLLLQALLLDLPSF